MADATASTEIDGSKAWRRIYSIPLRTTGLTPLASIVVSDDAHLTAVVGLENVVVVHTPTATLVCARDRVQDVKQLVRSL